MNPRPPVGYLARVATTAPRVPWDEFAADVYDAKPGEHVAIIGPTGQGKTVLMRATMMRYPFIVVFATKPQDSQIKTLIGSTGQRFVNLRQWHRLSPVDSPRRVLWPDARSIDSISHQRDVFKYALDAIFRESGRPEHDPVGWAVVIDELWYVINVLKLGAEIKIFLLQGRSLGHSLVLATQRPAGVPVEVYDQSTHLFFFRDNDRRNQDRLSEVNARDSAMIRHIVSDLEPHQFLYINTRSGAMVRSRVPPYLASSGADLYKPRAPLGAFRTGP